MDPLFQSVNMMNSFQIFLSKSCDVKWGHVTRIHRMLNRIRHLFFFFIRIQNSRILLWTFWSVWKSTIWAFTAWLLSQTSHSLNFMPLSETVVSTFLSLVPGCPCFLPVLFWHWLKHAGRCTDPFMRQFAQIWSVTCFFFLLFSTKNFWNECA